MVECVFLAQCKRMRKLVKVYVTNGYQISGVIADFDERTISFTTEGGKTLLIYKTAISTIELLD